MKQPTIEDIEALLMKNMTNGRGIKEQCRSSAVDIFYNWIKPVMTIAQDGAKSEEAWAVSSRRLGFDMSELLDKRREK